MTILPKIVTRPSTLLLLCLLSAPSYSANAIKDAAFFGMKLQEQTLKSVRDQMWNIGGFIQARSTLKQHNIDKFFTRSTVRDSYFVEFRYNNLGKVVSAKRLYRPYSIENSNQRRAITTRDVALPLIQEIGQPTQIKRKGWGGSPSYSSYIWQDDDMTIIVDREGSELYGNIFVQYIVTGVNPFIVEARPQKP